MIKWLKKIIYKWKNRTARKRLKNFYQGLQKNKNSSKDLWSGHQVIRPIRIRRRRAK